MPQTLQKYKKTFVGSRAFYAMVLAVVVPIIVQNAISNFVNLLDNIMVGKVGTDQMAGVSIANQLLFVANLCIFGGMSGAGIFAAQYHGASDVDGVRYCFRYKIWLSIALTAISIILFSIWGGKLIALYLNEENADQRIADTLGFGLSYLRIMLLGIGPFALSQAYASTLRETGNTALPMRAGIIAVFVNLVFNYLLIYDHFGHAGLGVNGAAIATVLSRYVELGIVLIATHRQPKRYRFIEGAYRSLKLPASLAKRITVKGMPLLLNEALWSLGVAMLSQCYSLRGLDVVAAMNISSTVSNLFNVVFISMGNATAIIIGQTLGSGEADQARDYAWKLIAFSLASCVVTGALLAIAAPFIPRIYNTEPAIRQLATRFLWVGAGCMPLFSFCNSCYFIIRSGGKTMITFLFDCVFSWVVSIPLALLLIYKTALPVVTVFLMVQLADIIKCVLGYIMVKRGIWIHNMAEERA
ncbi:MAG: MATE family efflux transporter [Clostridia bacterium]|nr:MATE family efflux transporter [Clostridia bacterium]